MGGTVDPQGSEERQTDERKRSGRAQVGVADGPPSVVSLRRQLNLDPVVLVLLLIGAFTGVSTIRRLRLASETNDLDQLFLVTTVVVLTLAWLRPFTRGRPAHPRDDDDFEDLDFIAEDVKGGGRVAVWLVLAILGSAIVAIPGSAEERVPVVIIVAGVFLGALGLRILTSWNVEKYLIRTLEALRPTRLVFLGLGAYAISSGLREQTSAVQASEAISYTSNRVVLLIFGLLLILGAFTDGISFRRRRDATKPESRSKSLGDRVKALEAMENRDAGSMFAAVPAIPSTTRPLVLTIVVNVATLAAAGLALYVAFFGNGITAANQNLLIFAGLMLVLAFVGDRIHSLSINKDGITMNSESTTAGSETDEPPAGATDDLTTDGLSGTEPITPQPGSVPATGSRDQARVAGKVQRVALRYLTGNRSAFGDGSNVDCLIRSPLGVSFDQTPSKVLDGSSPIAIVLPSDPLPVTRRRSLTITGRARDADKAIVDSFFHGNN